MTNINDVAKLANVSISTVSRVINGTAKVHDEKKNRVLKVIEDTGFKPNEIARSLFKKSSRVIGFITPNISNPFFSEVAKAIEDRAYDLGYRLILCNSDENAKKEVEYINMLSSMNADGIIITTNNKKLKEEVENCQLPIVLLDRKIKNTSAVASVQSNHYQGGVLATKHLIECGCKNIIHMRAPQEYSSAKDRYRGYVDVCKEFNINPLFIDCEYDVADSLTKSKIMLALHEKIDGVFACNDIAAISLYKILVKNEIRVPNDMQIVGFDDINMSSIVTPELTTIAQPIEQIGTMAVNRLIDIVENRETKIYDTMLDVKLMKRQTTKN